MRHPFYLGETQFRGQHQDQLTQGEYQGRDNLDTNRMSALLNKLQEYLASTQDRLTIKFSITGTGHKGTRIAVQLANRELDLIINTQIEFVAPALQRMKTESKSKYLMDNW